jgi:hypothetical protein
MAANYTSGFIIAYIAWCLMDAGPVTWGWIDVHDSFAITCIFTVISIARSYYWRRFFAKKLHLLVASYFQLTKDDH